MQDDSNVSLFAGVTPVAEDEVVQDTFAVPVTEKGKLEARSIV